jgi:membrane-bound lytic murein transglycosylase D
MKKGLLIVLFIFLGKVVQARSVRVPAVLHFAGMELRLHEKAREEIQNDVDALTRSEKYFNIKLDRVLEYFPIIERILRNRMCPDDFKYLVIQESALIPDAVSTSNAVGSGNSRNLPGKEVGLRIDRYVDERMNIISATGVPVNI